MKKLIYTLLLCCTFFIGLQSETTSISCQGFSGFLDSFVGSDNSQTGWQFFILIEGAYEYDQRTGKILAKKVTLLSKSFIERLKDELKTLPSKVISQHTAEIKKLSESIQKALDAAADAQTLAAIAQAYAGYKGLIEQEVETDFYLFKHKATLSDGEQKSIEEELLKIEEAMSEMRQKIKDILRRPNIKSPTNKMNSSQIQSKLNGAIKTINGCAYGLLQALESAISLLDIKKHEDESIGVLFSIKRFAEIALAKADDARAQASLLGTPEQKIEIIYTAKKTAEIIDSECAALIFEAILGKMIDAEDNEFVDYYELLELTYNKDDTDKVLIQKINKAYRKLALKLHPDVPGGSKEAFQKILEASEFLKNKARRDKYNASYEKKKLSKASAKRSSGNPVHNSTPPSATPAQPIPDVDNID